MSKDLLKRLFPVKPGEFIPEETEEWAKARLGRITASDRIARIMTDVGANAVLDEIEQELRSGLPFREFSGNVHTRHGHAHEDQALREYDMARVTDGEMVRKPGFTVSYISPLLGASPDFLIGQSVVGQVKCPSLTKNHIELLYNGPGKYVTQIQCESLVTGRKNIVFISYDPRMPAIQQLHHEEVQADVAWQALAAGRVLLLESMLESGARFGIGKLRVEAGIPSLF